MKHNVAKWMQPRFTGYIDSLAATLSRIECEVDTGYTQIDRAIDTAITLIKASQAEGGSVWLFGNGGSGTIADHIACDMVKMCGWRAFALTNPALTTTYANDVEYARCFIEQLQVMSRPGDVLIGMSCSGMSQNVVNVAAPVLRDKRQVHITLSGFEANNHLRAMMPNITFWVPSMKYGEVQIAHLAILHAMIDLAGGGA